MRATGKVRVYLQGNIHGGEVCGKEALLHLVRDLGRGVHDRWAADLVILVLCIKIFRVLFEDFYNSINSILTVAPNEVPLVPSKVFNKLSR